MLAFIYSDTKYGLIPRIEATLFLLLSVSEASKISFLKYPYKLLITTTRGWFLGSFAKKSIIRYTLILSFIPKAFCNSKTLNSLLIPIFFATSSFWICVCSFGRLIFSLLSSLFNRERSEPILSNNKLIASG